VDGDHCDRVPDGARRHVCALGERVSDVVQVGLGLQDGTGEACRRVREPPDAATGGLPGDRER
jgi:hypothetical protein